MRETLYFEFNLPQHALKKATKVQKGNVAMAEIVNWGILGAAKFARQHMAPAIHAARGARLAGLATSSPEKFAVFAEFAPDLKNYDTYDALLADPMIDAVYIPLPNHLHVEWSKRALAAGKHVLCEKPVGLTASDAAALIAARDKSGLFATEAYMIVHHPQWQRAKALYEQGAIGHLRHVDGVFSFNNAQDTDNIRNKSVTGGGAIYDIGVYTYGSTRWLTGQDPVEITHADLDFEKGVDVTARVSARFDGFRASWMNSMRMHPCQQMRFVGEDGVLTFRTPFNANVFDQAELELSTQITQNVERFTGVNQYVLQVEAFCATVRSDAAYPWHLEDAKATLQMIQDVFAKAQD